MYKAVFPMKYEDEEEKCITRKHLKIVKIKHLQIGNCCYSAIQKYTKQK